MIFSRSFRLCLAAGIFFLASLGCVHAVVTYVPPAPKEKAFYDDGLKAIVKKDYKTAVDKLSQLLQVYPTTRWLAGAHYNLGIAYEGQGNYAQASDEYKKVIEFYDGLLTRDEAEALYRYSICQEYLGDDSKMLFALLQLKDRGAFLTKEQAEVEVPARTAAAYARLGNLSESIKYFSGSENALKKLRRAHALSAPAPKPSSGPSLVTATAETDLQAWLPRTLYSVGHLVASPSHDRSDHDFKGYLASLEQSQERLLRAAEAGTGEWSKKAAAELITAYEAAWDWIDKLNIVENPESLQHAKQRQERQRSMAADFDVTVGHLKLARTPTTDKEPELPQVVEIFKTADAIQRKINIMIDAPDIQDQETPESQRRNKLKGEGKILIKK